MAKINISNYLYFLVVVAFCRNVRCLAFTRKLPPLTTHLSATWARPEWGGAGYAVDAGCGSSSSMHSPDNTFFVCTACAGY